MPALRQAQKKRPRNSKSRSESAARNSENAPSPCDYVGVVGFGVKPKLNRWAKVLPAWPTYELLVPKPMSVVETVVVVAPIVNVPAPVPKTVVRVPNVEPSMVTSPVELTPGKMMAFLA